MTCFSACRAFLPPEITEACSDFHGIVGSRVVAELKVFSQCVRKTNFVTFHKPNLITVLY